MDLIGEIFSRGEGNDKYTHLEKVKLQIAFGLVVTWVALLFILLRFLASERMQVVEITQGKVGWVERAHQSMTKYRNTSLELNIPEEDVAEMSRVATVKHLSESGQEEALQAILGKPLSPNDTREEHTPEGGEDVGWVRIE